MGMMSYVSRGVATVKYYDSKFAPGGQPWTCTCSTAAENSLVGVWSCPGFYSGTVTITADYADDFTDIRTNDAVLFCKEDSGDCWKESTEGADLAPGQWTGTGGTSFEQCKSDAEAAGVLYFAWSGQVNGGYCKVLNSNVASPNLGTNEGQGYKLHVNKCQKCDEDFASISTEADRDAYVANCVDKGLYKEMVCPVMRALMGSGFLRWKSSEGGIPLEDLKFALTNVLGVTGGMLQFFNGFLAAFKSVLSDDKSILHFLRLPSVANHGASSGIIGAATGGTISDSDAFNEPEFDMLLQHSSNGWFSLPQWGDAVNFFAGRRYDEAQLLCPAVSGVAGCNQWATNSVNALNGADFPAIKDQAECRAKCALNQDCTSYMLHPIHGCALYKTLDGCTGNYGWTGYQMHCGVSVIATEKAMNVSNSTMNVSNSTMVPSIAPTMKDVGKVLIECKVGNIVPSASPTVNPTMEPSTNPTSSNPSTTPSQSPSMKPSVAPSFAPTFTDPSVSPTMAPTTSTPTNGPTAEPTVNPTLNPTANPSGFPTTSNPTVQPTDAPSFSAPTSFPSSAPTTSIPSLTPSTSIPSSDPTTSNPTISPTSQPSAVEVFEVAEAKDGIFLILLCVGVGCTVVCCICCTIYFKPIFFGKTDCEENGKRNPELRKSLSH